MSEGLTGQQIRKVLLEVIDETAKEMLRRQTTMQSRAVLDKAAQRLNVFNLPVWDKQLEYQQALLMYWHDLIRTGYIAWGYDLNNPDPPFFHLTEQGRRTLRNLSRDPANPDGYLAHLSGLVKLNPVAESYLQEALKTYTVDCSKATAVMIGAASESIVLQLGDSLVAKMQSLSRNVAKDLTDWRISRVLAGIEKELNAQQQNKNMPNQLSEAYQAYWSSFTGQIRIARNDAGHPSSIDPVTPETVHASLLIFPELAKLAYDLMEWIQTGYK